MTECSAIITIPKSIKTDYKRIIGELRKQKRSKLSVKETQKGITITIEADDITALRATMNNIIRDVQVIEGASVTSAEDKTL